MLYYTTAKSAKRSTAEFKEELAKQAAAMQEMVGQQMWVNVSYDLPPSSSSKAHN